MQLYWLFQNNGLPASALPNGPSSLSAEERERLEEQKQRDVAASLQNLQHFGAASAIDASHFPVTELSLTPENNFVFRADTPPTGTVSPKADTVGSSQENRQFAEQPQHQGVLQPRLPGGGYDYHAVQSHLMQQAERDKYQPHRNVPHQSPVVPVEPAAERQEETLHSRNNPDKNTPTNGGSNASQKLERRRNKKKRPPNYYENLEKGASAGDAAESPGSAQFLEGTAVNMKQPELVDHGHAAVNIVPHQNFTPNVPPTQNVRPEMMTQIMALNQQQYAHYYHAQQQQAMTVLNTLIQQGSLPGMVHPMQVQPPHVLQPMAAQIPPGQNMQRPAEIPAQDPSVFSRETTPPFAQQRDAPHHDRRPVEYVSGQPLNPKRPSPGRDRPFNHGHGQPTAAPQRPPPKQELPSSDFISQSDQLPPNVPQAQEPSKTEPIINQGSSFQTDSIQDEAQRQLHESIEKVTSQYQALQMNESIKKFANPNQSEDAERTRDDKGEEAGAKLDTNQTQMEENSSLPNEKSEGPEVTLSNVSAEPNCVKGDDFDCQTPEKELIPSEGEEQKCESQGEKLANDGSVDASDAVPQETDAVAEVTQPDATPASKPAWGTKPAGAWADLFKNTETAARSVVIYADSHQASVSEDPSKSREMEAGSREASVEKSITAAEDRVARQLGGWFSLSLPLLIREERAKF